MINMVSNETHHSTEASQHLEIVFLPFWRIGAIIFPRHLDQPPFIRDTTTARGGTGTGMVANDCIEVRIITFKYVGPTFKCLQGCISATKGGYD